MQVKGGPSLPVAFTTSVSETKAEAMEVWQSILDRHARARLGAGCEPARGRLIGA
jgi:hypothetical protein